MLRRYLASEAYMYCGETLYNIPWMLLYFSGKYISLWHVRVRKESWLHEFLRERKDLSLFPVISKEGKKILYLCVEKTGKWMDLRLDFVEHEQKYSSKEYFHLLKALVLETNSYGFVSKNMRILAENICKTLS